MIETASRPLLMALALPTWLGAVAVSCVIGASYWLRNDAGPLAALAIIADVFGALALPLAAHQWGARSFARAVGAVIIGLSCMTFTAGTTWAVLSDDARSRALTAVQSSDAYTEAKRDFERSVQALDRALAQPRPSCTCPATIAAWQAAQDRQTVQLADMRNSARVRLDRLIPEARLRVFDVVGALMLEIVKIGGLFAFGSASQAKTTHASPHKSRRHGRMMGAVVGAFGLGAQVAHAQSPLVGAYLGAPMEPAIVPAPPMANGADQDRPVQRRALRIAEARQMLVAGMTKVAIARQLGVCRNTVGNWLRDNSARPRGRKT